MYENLKAKVNAYHDTRKATFANDLDTITTGRHIKAFCGLNKAQYMSL